MNKEEYFNKCIYCNKYIGLNHLICPSCKGKTYPRTKLSNLICDKWFLSLTELANRTGTKLETIINILKGDSFGDITYNRLIKYLENYQGEI